MLFLLLRMPQFLPQSIDFLTTLRNYFNWLRKQQFLLLLSEFTIDLLHLGDCAVIPLQLPTQFAKLLIECIQLTLQLLTLLSILPQFQLSLPFRCLLHSSYQSPLLSWISMPHSTIPNWLNGPSLTIRIPSLTRVLLLLPHTLAQFRHSDCLPSANRV